MAFIGDRQIIGDHCCELTVVSEPFWSCDARTCLNHCALLLVLGILERCNQSLANRGWNAASCRAIVIVKLAVYIVEHLSERTETTTLLGLYSAEATQWPRRSPISAELSVTRSLLRSAVRLGHLRSPSRGVIDNWFAHVVPFLFLSHCLLLFCSSLSSLFFLGALSRPLLSVFPCVLSPFCFLCFRSFSLLFARVLFILSSFHPIC